MKQIARLIAPPFDGLYRAECGLELAIRDRHLYADEAAELQHALWHIGINLRLDRAPDDGSRTGSWVVWRVDDSGNRFDVERYVSESSARCVAATLEARAHKQNYGVARSEPRHAAAAARWALFRQDDGGTRYPMRAAFEREGLEVLAELLNAEPRHKQMYFVAPCDGR